MHSELFKVAKQSGRHPPQPCWIRFGDFGRLRETCADSDPRIAPRGDPPPPPPPDQPPVQPGEGTGARLARRSLGSSFSSRNVLRTTSIVENANMPEALKLVAFLSKAGFNDNEDESHERTQQLWPSILKLKYLQKTSRSVEDNTEANQVQAPPHGACCNRVRSGTSGRTLGFFLGTSLAGACVPSDPGS